MRKVKLRLQIAAQRIAAQMSPPPIKGIKRQRFTQQRVRFRRAMELTQRDDLQVAGPEVIRVEAQRAVQVFHGGRPVVPGAIYLREGVVASRRPSLIPGRFVKRSVGVLVATKMAQAEAEIVISLAVSRVGVATREPLRWPGENAFSAMPNSPRLRCHKSRAHCCSGHPTDRAAMLHASRAWHSGWRGGIDRDAGRWCKVRPRSRCRAARAAQWRAAGTSPLARALG
jgi:hypothetical protein